MQDAERYLKSYEHAIEVIGAAGAGLSPHERSSISIKLSALEPRYTLLQHERVMRRLVPKALALARRAARSESSSPSMPKRPTGWIFPWM